MSMKNIYLVVCVLVVSLVSLPAAEPETPAFPGVQKAMTPEQYEAAGLSKLDPAERAKLDEFIKNYVAVSNEKVATTAVGLLFLFESAKEAGLDSVGIIAGAAALSHLGID